MAIFLLYCCLNCCNKSQNVGVSTPRCAIKLCARHHRAELGLRALQHGAELRLMHNMEFKNKGFSATLRYATLHYATLRYATLCYATLRYATHCEIFFFVPLGMLYCIFRCRHCIRNPAPGRMGYAYEFKCEI
jgi:hypothetical protein